MSGKEKSIYELLKSGTFDNEPGIVGKMINREIPGSCLFEILGIC